MEHFLNEFEVAELLHMSVSTLRTYRSTKRGPRYHKIGGTAVRYRSSDIDEYIDRCLVHTAGR